MITHTLDPLHTDFYQVSMAYSYFKMDMHEQKCTFEAFYRKTPFKGEVMY